MKTLSLIGLGTLALLTGLLVHAPVATLLAWSQPKDGIPPVQLLGATGTLTAGSANQILINGRPAWGELEWQFKPLHLLLARAAYHLQGQSGDTLLRADVSLLPTQSVHMAPLALSGTLKSLLTTVGHAYLPVDGAVRLNAEKLALSQGWPTHVQGKVELQALQWTLARDPVTLGDFQADVGSDAGIVTAKLSSVAGPLELTGEAIAKPDRSYRLQMKFRIQAAASEELRTLVASLGSPDAAGFYHVQKEGQLP